MFNICDGGEQRLETCFDLVHEKFLNWLAIANKHYRVPLFVFQQIPGKVYLTKYDPLLIPTPGQLHPQRWFQPLPILTRQEFGSLEYIPDSRLTQLQQRYDSKRNENLRNFQYYGNKHYNKIICIGCCAT